MAKQAWPLTFAELLRQLRLDAGLTQAELAEAAELSPEAISALERGVHRTPRMYTARQLADALNLVGPQRDDSRPWRAGAPVSCLLGPSRAASIAMIRLIFSCVFIFLPSAFMRRRQIDCWLFSVNGS